MPPPWVKAASAVADPTIPRPRGAPGCLSGLTIVRTGELKSMTEDQLKSYVSIYGGRVTGSVSGKTSYLVVGSEPGQTKQNAAREKKVKMITEEQFYDLVRTRSKKLGYPTCPEVTY